MNARLRPYLDILVKLKRREGSRFVCGQTQSTFDVICVNPPGRMHRLDSDHHAIQNYDKSGSGKPAD